MTNSPTPPGYAALLLPAATKSCSTSFERDDHRQPNLLPWSSCKRKAVRISSDGWPAYQILRRESRFRWRAPPATKHARVLAERFLRRLTFVGATS
jgi:hypothetical protein